MEQLVSSALARQVLESYQTPSAAFHAVWPQRHQVSARVWVFVDYLADHFEKSCTRAAGLVVAW